MKNQIVHFEGSNTADWAARIGACWRQSLEAVIATGRLIAEAKEALPHGDFSVMIRTQLPFGARTAQRLMQVAADSRITNATHASLLPPSWATLYELTRLDDETFSARVADGTISAGMDRKDISTAVKQQVRATREITLGMKQRALPNRKYGVILADPEWRFDVYSRDTGLDRSADNHYPTSSTEEIMARPVREIAADDCVLFLWATVPMLPDALKVMAAWGFEYKSHQVWAKDRVGTGYWFRNMHELLLVGTRGQKIPAPAPGTRELSVVQAEVREHSRKPDIFYEFIEGWYPTLPKIELNARHARAGWDAWGLEAPTQQDSSVTDDGQTQTHPSREVESESTTPKWSFLPVHDGPCCARDYAVPVEDDDLEIPAFLRRVAPAQAEAG